MVWSHHQIKMAGAEKFGTYSVTVRERDLDDKRCLFLKVADTAYMLIQKNGYDVEGFSPQWLGSKVYIKERDNEIYWHRMVIIHVSETDQGMVCTLSDNVNTLHNLVIKKKVIQFGERTFAQMSSKKVAKLDSINLCFIKKVPYPSESNG
jgi:hypothetical protein